MTENTEKKLFAVPFSVTLNGNYMVMAKDEAEAVKLTTSDSTLDVDDDGTGAFTLWDEEDKQAVYTGCSEFVIDLPIESDDDPSDYGIQSEEKEEDET